MLFSEIGQFFDSQRKCERTDFWFNREIPNDFQGADRYLPSTAELATRNFSIMIRVAENFKSLKICLY